MTTVRSVNATAVDKLLCEDRTGFGLYATAAASIAADSTVSSTAVAGITTGAPTSATKPSGKRPKSESGTPELMRCKRRISFAQLGYNIPPAPQSSVSRRNERERNRVKLVNLGFATLREHVPNGSTNKKMSKVETLRSAVEYIRKLQELLDDEGGLNSPYTDSSAGSPAAENVSPTNLIGGSGSLSDANNARLMGVAAAMCPPSSVSPTCSVASSPTPSYTSDCSYEPLSPEEEDLLDFTSWFT